MASEKIDILLQNQLLEVDLNDLRGNDDALIGILSQDPTNHKLFLRFAFEYHKRGMLKEFEKFLLAGKSQAQNHRLNNSERHILLLNTLSSYYIETAKKMSENQTLPSCNPNGGDRNISALLSQAAELLNDAEKISRMNKYTFVGKANLLLTKIKPGSANEMRSMDQVFNNYRSAFKLDPNFIPALIGLAGVHFRRKNFQRALELYQNILTIQPDIVPDVRVPIGICFAKLSMETEAELAFQRSLELNPENANALMMLSLLDLNRSKNPSIPSTEKKALVKSANANLFKAFSVDPKNSLCNAQMAARFFQKDQDKADIMASSALLYTKCSTLRAEALSVSGRIAHSKGDYSRAFELYKKASLEDPDSVLIQFYLATIFIEKSDTENAIKCLEKIVSNVPQDYDSLKLIFSLYSISQNSMDKAVNALESIAKVTPKLNGNLRPTNLLEDIQLKDVELLSDIAVCLEQSNSAGARKKYLELRDLLESQNKEVPPELLNNIAVLYHLEAEAIQSFFEGRTSYNFRLTAENTTEENLTSAFSNAELLYQQALTKLAEESSLEGSLRIQALKTSIRYNVARLFEERGDIDKAEANYKDLLKSHPAFVECLLRIGFIEQSRGNNAEALNKYSDALAIDHENPLAWSMIGNLHLQNKAYRPARKSFEKVLEQKRHDTYALCNCGNLCLVFARGDQPNRGLHFSRAIEYFCKTLSLDPSNMHAACGIAIAYAEVGKFQEARDVFNQIHELSGGDIRIAINAGQVFIELGQILPAIALYENALKKGRATDVDLLRALSKAYYIHGKTTKDPSAMKNARIYIQKAIRCFPGDQSLWFNLALIEQQIAQVLNEQPSEKRSIDALKNVLKDIEISARFFKYLASLKANKSLKFDTSRAKERADFTQSIRKITEKKIHESEVLKRQREERLKEIKELKERAEIEKKEKEAAEKEAELKREEELAAKRREILAQNQALNEKMRIESSKRQIAHSDEESDEEKPRKSRKKKTGAIEEDEGKKLSNAIVYDSDED